MRPYKVGAVALYPHFHSLYLSLRYSDSSLALKQASCLFISGIDVLVATLTVCQSLLLNGKLSTDD